MESLGHLAPPTNRAIKLSIERAFASGSRLMGIFHIS